MVAAFIHGGIWLDGYEHQEARVAETVIAGVLVFGVAATWVRPNMTRAVGIILPTFASFGTLVGVFMIIVGVGPRTILDVVYHLGIVGVLPWGVNVAVRRASHGAARLV